MGESGLSTEVVRVDGQLMFELSERKYKLIARGAVAGLASSLFGLFTVIMFADPTKVLSLCVLLGAVIGGCGVTVITAGRFRDMAERNAELAKRNAELEAQRYREALPGSADRRALPSVRRVEDRRPLPTAPRKPARPKKAGAP